ncbi:MAG: hypothetical protein ACR2QV_06775 [Gammaproteobacteria bacterium]
MDETRTQSRRWVLASKADSLNAVVEIAGLANRWISIYTPDLEEGIYDQDAFLDVAKRLVLAKRYARIRVLISEPHRLVRSGHKFVTLGRRLNTYIEFRNVHEDFREHREAFLIADKHALMYRVDGRRWEGIADTHEPPVAKRYLDQFDEIWDRSAVQQELRELRV